MSTVSHKSSLETIVEKGHDPLQFLRNPEHFREQIDLKGLFDSARKSFATLKLWPQAIGCFDHFLVQVIINNIAEQSNKCHTVIKKSLTGAKHGQTFAENVVVFCDALADKHNSEENLSKILLDLTEVAEKAHKRSVKAREQLIGVRDGLSEISNNMRVQVSKIQNDTLVASGPDDDTYFNGVNTCFVTCPKSVVPAPNLPSLNHFPGDEDLDSDDEDDVLNGNSCPAVWSSFSRHKHITFLNAERQLSHTVQDISVFIQQLQRVVDWWAGMKTGLDDLKSALSQIILSRAWVTPNTTRGWNEVADQFCLYVFRTTPLITDYFTYPRYPGYGAPISSYPLPPLSIPPVMPRPLALPTVAPILQTDKPKPLWKRLCCNF